MKCETCRFWIADGRVHDGKRRGKCYFMPPVVNYGSRPVSNHDEFCAKWKEKK